MSGLPAKPEYRQPCNHCGRCCTEQLCPAAALAFPGDKAPCRMLFVQDGKALCGMVLAEESFGLAPILRRVLGIGHGCSMPDADTTDEDMSAFDLQSMARGIQLYGKANG